MNLPIPSETREARFAAYVDALAEGLGHADRIVPMQAYCTGLLLPGERKSIEPMAARLAPPPARGAPQTPPSSRGAGGGVEGVLVGRRGRASAAGHRTAWGHPRLDRR